MHENSKMTVLETGIYMEDGLLEFLLMIRKKLNA